MQQRGIAGQGNNLSIKGTSTGQRQDMPKPGQIKGSNFKASYD